MPQEHDKQKDKNQNIHAIETELDSGSRKRTRTDIDFLDAYWTVGEAILSKYKVEEILGKGGMGVVYRVSQANSNNVYAVKTLRTSKNSVKLRRRMMREIRTWMDLPQHPNLARCYFFRTVDENLTVFSEYIDGGTVFDWIRSDPTPSFPEILDVLIQLAWGLHVAHINGVVHQDVKTSNALITTDRVVKLTDFGLSSVDASFNPEDLETHNLSSHLVTTNGMTPAYSSPEQINRKKLSHKTDIWSFGISILELLAREITWLYGTAGPTILEELSQSGRNGEDPVIPLMMQPLLVKCLKTDPELRWNDMLEIADELKRLYQQVTGELYYRPTPEFMELPVRDQMDRQSLTGDMWSDPQDWLEKALEHRGMDSKDAVLPSLPVRKGSRTVQAIVDLEVFEMAERIYKKLIAAGRDDLEWELSSLRYQKSFIHEYLDDNETAWELMSGVLDFYEMKIVEDKNREVVQKLVNACLRVGSHLHHINKYQEAQAVFDRAVEVFTPIVEEGLDWVPENDQAMVYVNKTIVALDLVQHDRAVEFSGEAIEILKKSLSREFSEKAQFQLGKAYSTMAGALAGMDKFRDALNKLNDGIGVLMDLAVRCNHPKAKMNVIYNLLNKSMLLMNLNDLHEAVETLDRAIDLVTKMINEEDRIEMRMWLATITLKKGQALHQLESLPDALRCTNDGIELLEHLVHKEGKAEAARELFFGYSEKAAILEKQGDLDLALKFYDQVIEVLTEFTDLYQQRDLGSERARYIKKRDNLKARMGLG